MAAQEQGRTERAPRRIVVLAGDESSEVRQVLAEYRGAEVNTKSSKPMHRYGSVIAALGNDREHIIAESADLVFHLLVLLKAAGVRLEDVEAALEKRTAMSGLQEKASRKGD